ncbi:hypothetical protein [Mycolicibacter longobardus]|uniref:Uncharacterized protein n=1 Tax=Mycolicibacter longobardus TaxID=1108812 RepID=A0A1X1Y8J1_9MYCO|nr:hypothetical protein [Mycolicibacter longobardus]MCV7384113.1 hypothetical protein [Mycolicibacter longobardus]ORW07388.1 hypothetical protein AWC16_21650 [Mycolicibacter longobardus]
MKLDGLQRLLDHQLSIRQLFYLAVMGAVALNAYLVIGLFWAGNHYQHLHDVRGADKVFSVLGEIVAWPVLIIADIHLR